MQPFRAVPSPGQYEVRKNVNSDESEWNFAEDAGTFEEGKLIGKIVFRQNYPILFLQIWNPF